MIIYVEFSPVLQMGLMLPDYQGSKFLFLYEQQHGIRTIQGEIVCTDKAGSEYGVYAKYNKNNIRNVLILFEGG